MRSDCALDCVAAASARDTARFLIFDNSAANVALPPPVHSPTAAISVR